jgi:hypothetical protein
MALSKTRTNQLIEDAPAPAAEDALTRFQQFDAVLRETHQTISDALRQEQGLVGELGRAEIVGGDVGELRRQLDAVTGTRAVAVRRRSSAADCVVELEGELRAGRAVAESARQAHAAEAVREFQGRYHAAVSALQMLWNEGEALARIIKAQVPMPVPARMVVSPIDGTSRVLPLRSGDVVGPLDAEAVRLSERLDQFDAALGRVAGIRQSREIDARHFQLAANRRTPMEYLGSYRVVREITSLTDGLAFAPGELVDRTLIGDGSLARLVEHGRFVRPVHLEPATAA